MYHMGRKSNAKKVVRELVKDSGKKKSKKQIKKEIKEKSKVKKQKSKINYTQIFGLFLTLLSLFLLSAILILLLNKAFQAKSISKLLPAKTTILSVELNIDLDHLQNIKGLKLLQKNPLYSKETLIKFIESKLAIDFDSKVSPWIGRKAGYAIIEGDNATPIALYFLETQSIQKTLDSFPNKKQESLFLDHTIYEITDENLPLSILGYDTFDYPKFFTFQDDYLVASPLKEGIEKLILTEKNNEEILYFSPEFRRIDNNLPLQRLAFAYANFDLINKNHLPDFNKYTNTGLTLNALTSYLNLFKSEGIVLVAKEENFAIQSFINTKSSGSGEIINLPKKYKGELLNFIPENIDGLWASEDLESRLETITTTLGEDQSSDIKLRILHSSINEISRKYFGGKVDFKTDIIPLFNKEFAIFINTFEEKQNVNLLIQVDDTQKQKIEFIISEMAKTMSAYDSQRIKYELPDGTFSYELVAIPGDINSQTSEFEDITITTYNLEEKDFEISYAFIDNLAIISTSKDGLSQAINTIKSKSKNFAKSQTYNQMIDPIIMSSDELLYINLSTVFKEFNLPFKNFSSGKNYFNDGIVTINFLNIN